jgi:hypothetical protein
VTSWNCAKTLILPNIVWGPAARVRLMKAGTLRSGRSGKKVTSRKQAIAIGLSEARKAGARIPKQKARKRAA